MTNTKNDNTIEGAKPSFTPGPWAIWKLAPSSDPKERDIITTIDGETEICGIIQNPNDSSLIAAAPELYEALRIAEVRLEQAMGKLQYFKDSNFPNRQSLLNYIRTDIATIKSALAKAIGEGV